MVSEVPEQLWVVSEVPKDRAHLFEVLKEL